MGIEPFTYNAIPASIRANASETTQGHYYKISFARRFGMDLEDGQQI
jgi:hypothetical protein